MPSDPAIEIAPELSMALAKAAQASSNPEQFLVIAAQAIEEGATIAEAIEAAAQLT